MTTPAAVPPPNPPPQGGAREDQAAAIAAAVGTVYAAAEAAALKAITDMVMLYLSSKRALATMIVRRLAKTITAIFGSSRQQAISEVSQMPHANPGITASVSQVLSQTERAATGQALEAFQQVISAATSAAGGSIPSPPQLPGIKRTTPPGSEAQAVIRAIDSTRGGLPGTNTSYSALQAAQKALDDLALHGITAYTDRAGRRWPLSSYVEMATRTEISNRLDDLMTQGLANSGVDCVWTYTDSSEGSCPRCLPWISKVLSISGTSTSASVILSDGSRFTRPVTGTLDEAKAAGFRHPSCRCSFTGLWDDINLGQLGHGAEPLDKSAATYRASQKQRALERNVRAAKQRAATAITPQAKRKARQHVAVATAASAAHRQAHGIRQSKVNVRRREQVAGVPGGPAK